ncbi:MAG: elongation factor G [Sandaracinaceae bacterium]|nr:elongation factor G [Sandaracinaceae bacterium]
MTRSNQQDRLRNFGIIAHVDAGKTTLTERILFHAGRIHRIGNVDAGTTTTDSRPEEKAKGITITAAAVTCAWREHTLTLIDTPGHADFTIEVERSLRVLDGAVVLIDAVAGVEPQTEKVWRQADRWRVPRIAFVNKLDRAGADLRRSVESMRERLGARPVVVTLPIGRERELEGVVDLVTLQAVRFDADGRAVLDEVPRAMADEVREARESLIEACAELDESLLGAWVAGDVRPEALVAALRAGTLQGSLLPTYCGSALANLGVPVLLDAIVELLPAPEGSVEAPLAALCFKVVHDAHGALAWVRVYSGTLRSELVGVGDGRRTVRVGRLARLFADRREAATEVVAGGIAALVGADVSTGDTLCDLERRTLLEPIVVPEAVMRVAIEPRGRDDRDKLGRALSRMRLEDPSLRVIEDPETGQTMLGGMGELHLEVSVSRLASAHGVHVAVGEPKVAYRETITRAAEVSHLHKKQSGGGSGQWARVVLRVEPAEPGAGLLFESRVKGGAIPKEWIEPVFDGCREAASSGPVGGHPVVDLQVILLDGETHSNDSSELAFALAGRAAFRLAIADAGAVLLEPLMLLEARVPEAHVGDVIGDLAARRGRVTALEAESPTVQIVRAEVPLAELYGYASRLGSLSHGRGTHHMELARYATA